MKRKPAQADGELGEQGRDLLFSLYSLLRTAGIHDIGNRAMDTPAGQLRQALSHFLRRRGQTVTAVAIEGQFFLNDDKVNVATTQYYLLRALEDIMYSREVGGISFLDLPSVETLKRFAHLFVHTDDEGEGVRASLSTRLEDEEIGSIQVAPPMRSRLDGEERLHGEALPVEVDATLAYAKAVALVEQYEEKPGARGLGGTHVRRVIQEVVDSLEETRDYLIGLTQWLRFHSGSAIPAVNTGVIAMALGVELNLPRAVISDIGLASFASVEARGHLEVFNPELALKQLLPHATWSESLLRRVLSVVQQPEVDGSDAAGFRHPMSRVYRVAHDFIAMTHGRSPYGAGAGRHITALEALAAMANVAERYDPTVFQALIELVGLYPLGSLVELVDQGPAFVVGRMRADIPLVRLRHSAGKFSPALVVKDPAAEIAAIRMDASADERAAAVLGPRVRLMVQRLSENLAQRSQLASVALRRALGHRD